VLVLVNSSLEDYVLHKCSVQLTTVIIQNIYLSHMSPLRLSCTTGPIHWLNQTFIIGKNPILIYLAELTNRPKLCSRFIMHGMDRINNHNFFFETKKKVHGCCTQLILLMDIRKSVISPHHSGRRRRCSRCWRCRCGPSLRRGGGCRRSTRGPCTGSGPCRVAVRRTEQVIRGELNGSL